MRVLLDTCVLSELQRPNGNPAVKEAVGELADDDIFVSVLTIGEIAKGVALLPSGKKKSRLQQWLTGLESLFPQRILSVDIATSQIWGEVTARSRKNGVTLPAVDGLIAATALSHGLHLMTRNVSDFASTGVIIVNPWESAT